MHFSILLGLTLQAALLTGATPAAEPAALEARASCVGGSGECVTYFSGPDCDSASVLSSYRPTCEGNCFQYSSFASVETVGDGGKGTGCEIYSDENCVNKIADMPDARHTRCSSFGSAQSMRCYFDC